jgi:hypothetical protein
LKGSGNVATSHVIGPSTDAHQKKKEKEKSEIRLLNYKINIGRTEITHARHQACSGIMRRACTFSKNSPTAACFWTQRCDKSGYFAPGLDNGAGCRGLNKTTPHVRLHSKCLSKHNASQFLKKCTPFATVMQLELLRCK